MNLIHVAALVACANEIYLYIDSLSEEDKESIGDNNFHLQKLIDFKIANFAIATNNIELLQYLIENNFITNDKALRWASENGYLKVVTLLLAKSGPEAWNI